MNKLISASVAVPVGVAPEPVIANEVDFMLRKLMRLHGRENRFDVEVMKLSPYGDRDVYAIRVTLVERDQP